MYKWKQKEPGESLGEFFLYLGIGQVSVFDGNDTTEHHLKEFSGIAKFETSVEVDGPVELFEGKSFRGVRFRGRDGSEYAFRGAEWVDGKFYVFAQIYDGRRGMVRRGRFTLERLYREIGTLPLRLRMMQWLAHTFRRFWILGAILNPL